MTPLQRACWTLLMIPLVAVAASIVTIAAAAICGIAITACPFVVFWVMWKPTWKEIKEGKLP